MRFRKISLLLLSCVLLGWGISTPAQAATDIQQSQYEVKLTPPKSGSSVQTGGDGGGITTNPTSPTTSGQGTTAVQTTATTGKPGNQGLTAAAVTTQPTGRLPQLSEQQWYGFGSLLGIILLLLFWIWKLSRKTRHSYK